MGNSGATDVIAYSAASEPRTVSITIAEVDSDSPTRPERSNSPRGRPSIR
jgi:hypothetical protein